MQYDEVKKVSSGHGDDYTTGSLLDYAYFKDNYRLMPVDLSRKKRWRRRGGGEEEEMINSLDEMIIQKKDYALFSNNH